MSAKRSEEKSRLRVLWPGLKRVFGVGLYLLLLGLVLEGLTVVLWQWVSFPIPLTLEMQILLTVPCVAACLSGVIWFNRTLNLIKAHLLGGRHELVTEGPFAYVRHPLYATIMMTIPALVVIWFADLLFFLPWILVGIATRCILSFEERSLGEAFGEEYQRYKRYVPALLPYKGNGGRRYREHQEGSKQKRGGKDSTEV